MLELKGIRKFFPANGVEALDGEAFELRALTGMASSLVPARPFPPY